jgi:hypothetical protein
VKRHGAYIVKPTRQPILGSPRSQFQRYCSTVISATNVVRLLELLGIRPSRRVPLHPEVRSGSHRTPGPANSARLLTFHDARRTMQRRIESSR